MIWEFFDFWNTLFNRYKPAEPSRQPLPNAHLLGLHILEATRKAGRR